MSHGEVDGSVGAWNVEKLGMKVGESNGTRVLPDPRPGSSTPPTPISRTTLPRAGHMDRNSRSRPVGFMSEIWDGARVDCTWPLSRGCDLAVPAMFSFPSFPLPSFSKVCFVTHDSSREHNMYFSMFIW
jgi:hypothetical protein